ncbi:hypothetical protein TSAR_011794 [Trichomalopsis sarcophagae]|uniref:Uncharacterized protein n=1 Tax=Trichomalopsis sarcophagae TaxID=543379 RepID=A0A232EUD5_9HYME|nr:hypothetical protein TSAR_011794 [Trichomalopsis sarcophagae]
MSPRTDALLIKRRQKLGDAKTKTLSRGLPKELEAVRALLYIYSYTHSHVPPRTPPANRLSGLAVTDRPFSISALKVTLKIRGVKLLEELTLYSLNAAENSGPLKQRRFPEDYRRDSKQFARCPISIAIHTQSCARANASHHSTLWPSCAPRTPPANRLSGLAVTDRPFSISALKVTLKIRGVKLLEGVVAV